jgi:outer membrane usher protein FimD/PapC
MTSALKNTLYPVDTVTTYPHSTEQLILTGFIFNIPQDTKITFIWKHNGTEMNTGIDTDFQDANIIFYRRIKDDHFESGAYSVEIYINDESSPSETVDFSVGY